LRQTGSRGHYVASRPPDGEPSDIAFDATFRAAASRGSRALAAEDVRVKVRETKLANLIVFAVDASGSMAAADRMVAAKGAVLSLLLDAYQKRDQVGMIAFRGRTSELLLSPTNSVDLAEKQLRSLPTGGRTPLSHALQQGLDVIERHRTLHREAVPLFVLISDGRPNVPLAAADPLQEAQTIGAQFAAKHIQSVVVDTEAGAFRLGLARQLATAMGGQYLRLDELEAGRLAGVVRTALGRTH
ncbi:MAG TPA: VWA domain-containing protein, partial [Chloroflexota bacterium]|nr:VWA domain-containing protein [Chloroflexota bacterium]